MKTVTGARPSSIAGQWYPSDPKRLAAQVDQYLESARLPDVDGEVIAIMAPHAGHIYSGPVAGYAFATLKGLAPDTVIVVSPMHHPYFEPLLTTAHDAYLTPLGSIPVNRAALETLGNLIKEELGINLIAIKNDLEHSLEIELPFLQRALSGPFKLVPIMVREQSLPIARGLGKAIARMILECPLLSGKNVLLVASTDLSHFYPEHIAVKLDAEVLKQVEALDPAGVIEVEEKGKGFACGRGALSAVLWAAKELGANRAQVLKHATSGSITGDFEQVVGYGAAVITRTAN